MALTFYHSGAEYMGTAQLDPALALGGIPSTTALRSLTIHRPSALPTIQITDSGGGNSPGNASIKPQSTDTLSYTAPGDTIGAATTVVLDVPVRLFSGNATAWIEVIRTTSDNLTDLETFQFLDTINTVTGGDNFTKAQAAAGANQYKAVFIKNTGVFTENNIDLWIDPSSVTCAVGIEEPDGDGNIQVIADTTTAPAAVTFEAGTTPGTGVTIASLAPGELYGVWIRTTISPGAARSPVELVLVEHSQGELRGIYRIEGTALYELFVSTTIPDTDNDTPVFISATETFVTGNLALTEGLYYRTRIFRNAYGLAEPIDTDELLAIDSGGNPSQSPPDGPLITELSPGPGGIGVVAARYVVPSIGDRAVSWVVYFSNDDTDPLLGTPTIVAMTLGGDEILGHETDAALDGCLLRCVVRTRIGSTDSLNTEEFTATASTLGPRRPNVDTTLGRARSQRTAPMLTSNIEVIPASLSAEWRHDNISTSLYDGANLVFRAITGDRVYFPSDWNFVNATISGASTFEGIEPVLALPGPSFSYLYIIVNGQRRMKIDLLSKTITADTFNFLDAILTPWAETGTFARCEETTLQARDSKIEMHTPWATVTDTGVLTGAISISQILTQTEIEDLG